MALSYGFFNSSGGDRKYTAEEFGQLFEGIIKYGIFNSIGDSFRVKAIPNTRNVRVGSGRAMMGGRWLNLDAPTTVTVPAAHTSLHRIDSIVLDMDIPNRTAYIRVQPGTASTNPTPGGVKQETPGALQRFVLANVRVNAGSINVSQSDITSRIGTSDAPWVTGPLQLLNTDTATAQFEAKTGNALSEFGVQTTAAINEKKQEWDQNKNQKNSEWEAWFQSVKDQLENTGGTAAFESRLRTVEQWKTSSDPKITLSASKVNEHDQALTTLRTTTIPAAVRDALGAMVGSPSGFAGNVSRLSASTWRFDSDYGTVDVTRTVVQDYVTNLMSYPWVTNYGKQTDGTTIAGNPDGSMGFWGRTHVSLQAPAWVPMYVDLAGKNGQQVYLQFMYVNNASEASYLPQGVYNIPTGQGLPSHSQPWTQKAARIYTATWTVSGGTSSASINFQIPGWGKECTVYQAGMYTQTDWNKMQLRGLTHGFSLSDKSIYHVVPEYENDSERHAYVKLNIGGYTDLCTWTPKGGGSTMKFRQHVKPYGYEGFYTMEVTKL